MKWTVRAQIWLVLFLAFGADGAGVRAAADEPDGIVGEVIGLLQEPDKEIRALGLDYVRKEAPGSGATQKFAELLPQLSAEAQIGLLGALADRGDRAARPPIVALLAGKLHPSVRVAALASLGPLGEVSDVPLLVDALESASKAEMLAARTALERMPGDDVPFALSAAMGTAESTRRVILIEILAARRTLSAIPHLLKAASDANPKVQAAAMTALGQLAGPEQIPALLPAVLQSPGGPQRDAAERALAQVCGRIADVSQRDVQLLAAMDALGPVDRTALLPALGRVGGARAQQAAEAAIAAADAGVHEAGLRALYNWPDASIAPRLIELATDEPHPPHRAQALAALIRVAPLPDGRPAPQRLALLQQVMGMCARDEDRLQIIKRARAIRTIETLRFLLPYLDQPDFAQMACESVVELAHHRELRQPNKPEFHQALDRVIAISKDDVVIERANRYKREQTWARPKPAEAP